MTRQSEPLRAIERIPGWSTDDIKIEARLGGLSNTSYRIRHRGERFVLRLGDVDAADSSRDRDAELAIHRRAAQAGLAPDIVFADTEADILVTRYLEGQTLTPSELDDPGTLKSIANLLREVHALPLTGHVFEGARAGRYYVSQMTKNSAGPALLAKAERCIEIIERLPAPGSLRCCHNDVIAENLHLGYDLHRHERLRLLDWEYAADNDPYFDIASLIVYHELDDAAQKRLLLAYDANADEGEFAHLEACMQAYDALYWLWRAAR